jgi:hypothetical protein
MVRSFSFVLLRVISWIVLDSGTNRNDPRNHTNYTKLIIVFNRLLRKSRSKRRGLLPLLPHVAANSINKNLMT